MPYALLIAFERLIPRRFGTARSSTAASQFDTHLAGALPPILSCLCDATGDAGRDTDDMGPFY
jgi:hypothetical protein